MYRATSLSAPLFGLFLGVVQKMDGKVVNLKAKQTGKEKLDSESRRVKP